MKNPLHQHTWQDVSTNYVAPADSTDDMERYGYTRLFQRCIKCGEYQESVKPGHLVIRDVPETIDMPMRVHRVEEL